MSVETRFLCVAFGYARTCYVDHDFLELMKTCLPLQVLKTCATMLEYVCIWLSSSFLLACTRSSTSDLQPYLVAGVLQEITGSHKGATFLYSPFPPLPLVLWISTRTYFKNLLLYLHFLTLALGTSLYHPSHPDVCLLVSCFWWCSPIIISFCSFISKLLSLPCQGLSGLYTSFLSCSVFPPVFFFSRDFRFCHFNVVSFVPFPSSCLTFHAGRSLWLVRFWFFIF